VITGASSGIGAEIARSLARRGHDVVLVARRRDRLDSLARELSGAGASATALVCDLAEPDQRADLAAELGRRGRRVSVLCNSAGVGIPGHVAGLPVAALVHQLRLNTEAMVDLCGRFVPAMVERRRGAVLNVCSLSSVVPWPSLATYAASKAAALSFTEALHTEVRPDGVAVTAMCPGFVRTDFIAVAGLTDAAARAPRWVFDDPAAVAEHGVRAVQRNRRVAVHSVTYRVATAGLRAVPNGAVLLALDRWSPFRRGGAIAGRTGRPAASDRPQA
jgi:short-subunit dehydrogenase